MKALRTVGDVVSWLFEVYAPAGRPVRVPFWDDEHPRVDGEPPLTGDELVAVRQLIEERFTVALEQTADQLADADFGRAIRDMYRRDPRFPAAGAGNSASEGDCSPAEGPAAGNSGITGQPKSVVSAAQVPTGSELRALSPVGHPGLLRAVAIQLDEWAKHVACPAAIYCGSLVRQLRDAATTFENTNK